MTDAITIDVLTLSHAEGLGLPAYATDGAAGMDMLAAIADDTPITLAPMERTAIPTGLQMAIPQGYEVQIRPRSGLALKHGLTIVNAPGTIDSDYRGEIKILLINLGSDTVTINRGMRIAQMIVAPVMRAELITVDSLDATSRGGGGFGSTGQ
jgi:dUTP pyrophosphatase